MKKTILCALVAFISLVANAQSLFTSEVTGFTCITPENAVVIKNDNDAAIIATPDEGFVISAIPFQPSITSEEDVTNSIKTLAESVDIDLETAIDVDLNNNLLEGGIFIQAGDDHSGACVGVMKVKGGDLAYYITISCEAQYEDIMDSLLKSLDFNPDAVE